MIDPAHGPTDGGPARQRMQRDHDRRVDDQLKECRHYTGTFREVCGVGLNYRAVTGGADLGWGLRVPCHEIHFSHAEGIVRATCEQKSYWTREEAEANVTEGEQAIQRHILALKAAHDDAKANGLGRGYGGAGELACPVCDGGTIRYSVAALNGHMHAACSTKGCVQWME